MKFLRFLAIALVLLSVNIASATSTYSDRLVGVNSGIAIKVPVKVLTKTAITLSGEQTIDDVNCVDGDRVLVTANGVDSGIYIVHTGSWTRAVDWDGQGDVVSGTRVAVSQGSLYAGTLAYVTNTDPITIGTTNLTFEISLSVSDAVAASELPQAAGNKRISLVEDADGILSLWASNGIQWKKITEATTLLPPTVTSVSPVTGNIEGGYSATVYGSNFVADSVVHFGGTTATVIQNNGSSIAVTVPAHSAGVNSIAVTSPSGVVATLSNAFTYTESTLPLPVISAISSGTPATTEATITFTTDVNCSSYVEWGLTTTYTASNYPGHATVDQTSHSHTLTGLTPATDYHYTVHVTDINNNLVSSTDGTFTTATPVTFPVISAIDSGTPTTTGATITWTTDIAATSIVEYGPTNAYGYSTTLDPALVTSHSVVLSGLTDNTTYHYRVKSISAASAETVSADQTLTTDSAAGTVSNNLWANTVTPGGPYSRLATLGTKFKTTVAGNITAIRFYNYVGNAQVTVRLWDNAGTMLASKDASAGLPTGWQTIVLDSPVAISAETTYVVSYHPTAFVSAISTGSDAAGLAAAITVDKLYAYASAAISPGNGVYSLSAAFPSNKSPTDEAYYCDPVFEYASGAPTSLAISNINVSNITTTSAVINWTLSGVGSGYYEIGTVAGVYTITNSPGQLIDANNYTAHSQVVSGLTANTTYYYRVRSTDINDVETISPVNSFTTLATVPTGTYHAPPPTSTLVVNVRDKGAAGNGVTDDTAKIQDAIDQVGGTGGTVLVPAGTYKVTKPAGNEVIRLKSNMTLKLEAGATIKLAPTSSASYFTIYVGNVTNVNIVGPGTIEGERHEHTPTTYDFANTLNASGQNLGGEWGYGIYVDNLSSNIYIDGITSRENWGDGIAIGGGGGGINTNVNVYNVLCTDNRRLAMSMAEVNGAVIRDSIFSETDGAWPNGGIDIEPLNPGEYVSNVQILSNQFIHNHSSGVFLSGIAGRNSNITVNNNTFLNNGQGYFAAMVWANPGTGSSYSGNTFTGSGSTGNIVFALQ